MGTERRMVAAKGCGEEGKGSPRLMGIESQFCKMKQLLLLGRGGVQCIAFQSSGFLSFVLGSVSFHLLPSKEECVSGIWDFALKDQKEVEKRVRQQGA